MTNGRATVDDLTAAVDLPSGIRGAVSVRRVLRAVLMGWGFTDPDWLSSAVLVAGELVSNAIRHAGGGLALLVRAGDTRVWVAVVDGSPVRPVRRVADSGAGGTGVAGGGRGLLIVEALSARWGTDAHAGGKRVWATLMPYPTRG
jgi:anti-sigma regulatory factor (Ser/Thr protein kinase)